MYRYNYAVQKCMAMIKSGELGEIYQIDAEMSTYHSAQYRKWLKNFSGGSMYVFGSHPADLIVSILGEPERVYPFIKQTGFENIYSDDNNFAVPEYKKAIELDVKMTKATSDTAKNAYVDMHETVEAKDVPTLSRYDEMMRDLYLSVIGEKENIVWSDVPKPTPKDDEILINIHAAALNRADLLQRKGTYHSPKGWPQWPEPEVAGVIEDMGAKAQRESGKKTGDKVCALLIGEDIFKIQYLIAFVLISPGIVIGNAKNSKPKIA